MSETPKSRDELEAEAMIHARGYAAACLDVIRSTPQLRDPERSEASGVVCALVIAAGDSERDGNTALAVALLSLATQAARGWYLGAKLAADTTAFLEAAVAGPDAEPTE